MDILVQRTSRYLCTYMFLYYRLWVIHVDEVRRVVYERKKLRQGKKVEHAGAQRPSRLLLQLLRATRW